MFFGRLLLLALVRIRDIAAIRFLFSCVNNALLFGLFLWREGVVLPMLNAVFAFLWLGCIRASDCWSSIDISSVTINFILLC